MSRHLRPHKQSTSKASSYVLAVAFSLFSQQQAFSEDGDKRSWIVTSHAIAKGAPITTADLRSVLLADDDVKLAEHPNPVLHQPVTSLSLATGVAAREIPAGKILQQADIKWFVDLQNKTDQASATVAAKADWYKHVLAAKKILDAPRNSITPENARFALTNLDKAYEQVMAMSPARLKNMDAEERIRLSSVNPAGDYGSVGSILFSTDIRKVSMAQASFNLLQMKRNGVAKQTNLYRKLYETLGPQSVVTRICHDSLTLGNEGLKGANAEYLELLKKGR